MARTRAEAIAVGRKPIAVGPRGLWPDKIVEIKPNGNTLICDGPHGSFFKVSSGGQMVWKYVNPVAGGTALAQGDAIPGYDQSQQNSVFRCYHSAPAGLELQGKNLLPAATIESYPSPATMESLPAPAMFQLYPNYPNPCNEGATFLFTLTRPSLARLIVFDLLGRPVSTLIDGPRPAGIQTVRFAPDRSPAGCDVATLVSNGCRAAQKVLITK